MDEKTCLRETFNYPSSNKEHTIYAQKWIPEKEERAKAIIQIAHGMSEHSNRYSEFSNYLAQSGFVIFANDHAGHGKSLDQSGTKGFFGDQGGRDTLVKDMHLLSEIARRQYPELPFFLIGHSMGSFLSRKYTTIYREELTGAVYIGTGGANPFIDIVIRLSEWATKIKGNKSPGKLVNKLAFGRFNQRIVHPKTEFDWLSLNDENVQNYLTDPNCGFIFTNSAFYELFSLIKEVTDDSWAGQIPEKLPILLLSGAEDPVGDYGEGVIKTQELLIKHYLTDVSLKLYDEMRHEILNERNKLQVYSFIKDWLEKHIS